MSKETKESWLGPRTFPKIWIYICKIWTYIAVVVQVMILIVWIMLFAKDMQAYNSPQIRNYLGNVEARYGGSRNAGYIDLSNIPKHLGGTVFVACFDIAMMIFVIISACADFYWRWPQLQNVLLAFWVPGLHEDIKKKDLEFFFVISNGFMKLFIAAATGSQTFISLRSVSVENDTPLFALYTVFILLGSVPLTIIAEIFVILDIRSGNSTSGKV